MDKKLKVTLRCGHTITKEKDNAYAICHHDNGEFWGDLCEECFRNANLKLIDDGYSEYAFENEDAQKRFERTPLTGADIDLINEALDSRWAKIFTVREKLEGKENKDEERIKHLTKLMDTHRLLKKKLLGLK